MLKKVDGIGHFAHVEVAWVTTDVCMATTITGAIDRGFNAIAISDCVASYSPERHAATLEIIKATQLRPFGWRISNLGQFVRICATRRVLRD